MRGFRKKQAIRSRRRQHIVNGCPQLRAAIGACTRGFGDGHSLCSFAVTHKLKCFCGRCDPTRWPEFHHKTNTGRKKPLEASYWLGSQFLVVANIPPAAEGWVDSLISFKTPQPMTQTRQVVFVKSVDRSSSHSAYKRHCESRLIERQHGEAMIRSSSVWLAGSA